jgi:hypothetical protein
MGLWRVLLLAEVLLVFAQVPGFFVWPGVIGLEVKPFGVLPTVSGLAGSGVDSMGGRHAAARRGPAPWDLFPRGLDRSTTCAHAVTPRPTGSAPGSFAATAAVARPLRDHGPRRRGQLPPHRGRNTQLTRPFTFKSRTVPGAKHRSPASLLPSTPTSPEILCFLASSPWD